SCLKLVACVDGCSANDPTCITNCRNMWQNGIAGYDNLFDCMRIGCSTPCAEVDGGTACGSLGFPSPACDACVGRSCCAEALACSNNADCLALVQCIFVCQANDPVCVTDCQNQHPNATFDYRNLAQCTNTSCGGLCG